MDGLLQNATCLGGVATLPATARSSNKEKCGCGAKVKELENEITRNAAVDTKMSVAMAWRKVGGGMERRCSSGCRSVAAVMLAHMKLFAAVSHLSWTVAHIYSASGGGKLPLSNIAATIALRLFITSMRIIKKNVPSPRLPRAPKVTW